MKENISLEAKEIIKNLLEKGHEASAIKYAMEDGAFLLEAGISQEISEEIHFFLSNIKKRSIAQNSYTRKHEKRTVKDE